MYRIIGLASHIPLGKRRHDSMVGRCMPTQMPVRELPLCGCAITVSVGQCNRADIWPAVMCSFNRSTEPKLRAIQLWPGIAA